MSFEKDIEKFVKKTGRAAAMVLQGTALEIAGSVIERTPVGNSTLWKSPPPPGYTGGMARANWQIGINSPATGEVGTPDKSGGATERKAEGKLKTVKMTDSVFITNNLPYIKRLEDGWSSQAPSGMVAVTVRLFKRLVARQAKKARRKAK